MFADQDDIWCANKIELAIYAMSKLDPTRRNPILYAANYKVIDADGAEMEKMQRKPTKFQLEYLACQNTILGSTMGLSPMLAQHLKEFIFHPRFKTSIAHHDAFTLQFAFLTNSLFIHDNTAALKYRIHDSNTIGLRSFKRKFNLLEISQNTIVLSRQFTAIAENLAKPQGKVKIEKIKSFLEMEKSSSIIMAPLKRNNIWEVWILKLFILVNRKRFR